MSHRSALGYILKGFLPYSKQNLMLSFKPSAFFRELERITDKKYKTLENAYYTAIKDGLVEIDGLGLPRLTATGRQKAKLYEPTKLPNGAKLMIVFDVPEAERWKRRRLRLLLKELSFRRIQHSVWVCDYDFKDLVLAGIKEQEVTKHVKLYEVQDLY